VIGCQPGAGRDDAFARFFVVAGRLPVSQYTGVSQRVVG